MTLPPHVLAEVQQILDREARLALADELHVDPAVIPLRSGKTEPGNGSDLHPVDHRADDRPLTVER
jgi:hypothetical protein